MRGPITGLLLALPLAATAADLGQLDGFEVQWDTTLRTTLGFRTEPADPALLADRNADDGDRAFTPGLISDRVDVLSELQVSRDDLGFFVSGDGWYDGAYHGTSANNSPATFNPVSVPHNGFPAATRALDGDYAELLDAYALWRTTPGGLPLTLRLGRQTLLWGESLFFAANSIAGAMAPVDEIKSLGEPLARNAELLLPVAQADARLGLGSGFSLEAYVQFEWRRDRLPGVASYFSTADYLDAGGERLFLGGAAGGGASSGGPVPGGYYAGPELPYAPPEMPNSLLRAPDRTPNGPGQYGMAVRYETGTVDFGLYALRFAAKLPELFEVNVPVYDAYAGRYGLDFPRGIALYGASFSRSWNDFNLSGEVSARQGMPLVSRTPAPLPPGAAAPYAAGTTLHANLSLDAVLPPSRFWNGAEFLAELAANEVASVTRDIPALAPGRTPFAAALRAAFTPSYYEIAPNLDLAVPLGVGLGLAGRSRFDGTMNAGGGDFEAGLTATWRRRWLAELMFTHYIGGAARQALADRDFVTLSLTRTF